MKVNAQRIFMKTRHYDLKKIDDLSDHDKEFAQSLAEVFIEEIPEDMKHLADGVFENNREKVHEYAHKMKPTFDMFGLKTLKELKLLEAWGKSNENFGIEDILVQVQHEASLVIEELKEDFF